MRAHNIQRAHCTHMHADARASHLYPHTRGCASLVSRGARNTLVTFPRGDDVIPVGTRRDALTRGKNPADTPPKQTRRTLRGFPASYCLPMLLNILYAGRESSINRELQVSTTSFSGGQAIGTLKMGDWLIYLAHMSEILSLSRQMHERIIGQLMEVYI